MRYFLNSACLRGFLFLWPFGVVSGRERVPRLGSWKGSPWAPVSFLIYCFAILFAGFFFVGPVPWCPVPWCPVPWCPVLWYPVLQCPGALVLRALCPVPWCPVPCALCLVPCVLCPVPCGVVPWYLVPSDLCPAASSRIDDIMKSMRNKSTKTLLAVFYGTIYIYIYPCWVLRADLNFDNVPFCAAMVLENFLVESKHILVHPNRRLQLAMVLYDREDHSHVAVIFPFTVA